MCSYNAINGVPDCLNGELLRDTLYNEWSLQVRTRQHSLCERETSVVMISLTLCAHVRAQRAL
jgi:hypothetical protein